MLASEIISRARSLADLQSSKAISYNDEKNSINEAYKLVYNKLSESNDDFYLLEKLYTNVTGYTSTMPYNYLLPLPTDFYKLRTVSYLFNGSWYPMSRLPLNMRNTNTTEPYYRLRNNELWIVTGTTSTIADIQITYYPPPETITLPDYSTDFAETVPLASSLPKIYCIKDATTLYKCTGNTIVSYTANKTASTLIYTGASATAYPVYYKNLLFFYEGTALKSIDLTSAAVVTIKAVADNTLPFTVENNLIYYCDATNTLQNSYLGSSESTLFAGSIRYCVHKLGTASYIYIKAGSIEIDTVVQTPATYMSYPYFNYGDNVYTIDTALPVLYKANAQIGAQWNSRIIGMDTLDASVHTYSTVEDTNMSYPTNVIFEILAYQSAADFKRKYEEASPDLESKLGQLWDAFLNSVIRRDEYKPEKIQNAYNNGINWGNM